MHALQKKALVNARSISERIFTAADQAQNHCQVGNVGLALEVMQEWLAQGSRSGELEPLAMAAT